MWKCCRSYISSHTCNYEIQFSWKINQVVRVFANGPADLGYIPSHVIPKTLKMVLDTSLLITRQYKIHIEDEVEKSREKNNALPYTSV